MNRPINTSNGFVAGGRRAMRLPVLALGALVLSLALVPAAQAAGSGASTNGTVRAIVPDGQGGSYIGGSFTQVNGSNATYLAHVKADGTLDTAFNANISQATGGGVLAIAKEGSSLYIGGLFTSVNGTTRNLAAKVDATTGALDVSWNPNLPTRNSGDVKSILVNGSAVYLGGSFAGTGFNGNSSIIRNRLAKVNTTDGTVDSGWSPSLNNNSVWDMAISGSNLYFIGGFTLVGTTTRNRVAAVDTSTGSLTGWDPNLNQVGRALAISGSTVFIGGTFTQVGGVSRNRVAAVDATTGSLVSGWNANANGNVLDLSVSGGNVYLGGEFTTVGGTGRNRAAAVDTTTGATLSPWNPNLNAAVWATSVEAGVGIAIGGEFTTLNGAAQDFFAGPAKKSASLNTGSSTVNKQDVIKSSGYSFSEGATPTNVKFNWQRCLIADDADSCTDMTDGTFANWGGAWYGTRDADIGYQVRIRTYWDTVSGVVNAFSALSGIVVPVGTVAPTLSSQSPKVGVNVASTFGTWKGFLNGTSTATYEWQQCTTSTGGCSAIVGAPNAANYKPVAGSVGKFLRVKLTITTRGQSASQFSAITTNAIVS